MPIIHGMMLVVVAVEVVTSILEQKSDFRSFITPKVTMLAPIVIFYILEKIDISTKINLFNFN